MFQISENFVITYENFDDGKVQISKASFWDREEMGGDPAYFAPDFSSYQQNANINYDYATDFVTLTKGVRQGYFIGCIGSNHCNTPLANQSEFVYNLWEFWLNISYEDGGQPTEFLQLFHYLLRHAKNNGCKLLQVKMDKARRYQPFYDNLQQNFAFQQFDDYLIKVV